MPPNKIFLIGLPGSGKTTAGKQLGIALGKSFIDLDDVIIKKEGTSISTIFETKGEQQFRSVERACLDQTIKTNDSFIMATGGGAPCFFDNLELMNENGLTIFINTPVDVIKERLQADQTRPLMTSNTIESLLEEREKWYIQAKEIVHSYEELFEFLDHT